MKYELKKDKLGRTICPLCKEPLLIKSKDAVDIVYTCNSHCCTIKQIKVKNY